jgi:acyl carrier protein
MALAHRPLVRQFILKNFLFTEDDSALGDGDSLINAGVIDSTGVLELITHLEETLSIRVPPEEMVPQNFDSIDAICAYLARKTGA